MDYSGFKCISDFKVQSFLNDNLSIDWNDKFFMGATNVRTHYNNFKGDVIFTFYNKDDAYSLCYNERMKMWVSRYSWMPLLSANIDNYFYSFDRDLVAKYTNICAQAEKQIGIVCEKPFYNSEQDIKLIYKSILPNVTIKIDSCKFGDQKYEKSDIFTPIIANNEIYGMYYMNGISGFINEGGSIDKTNDDLTLWRKPLKWCGKQKIILYLQSKKDVTSDMIPDRVFVYCNNNQSYITHTSSYDWQSLIPDSHETNWWYISQYVDLKIEYDSDGNIWETGIITDGWSTPKKYNAQNFVENNWKQISEHDVEDSLIDIDFNKNLFLGNCHLSNSNKIGNFTYTSSVPIIIYEESEEEIDINFIDHDLCSAYVYNDGINHYLHLPSMFKYNNSEIVLKAYYEDQLLETYTLTIGLEFNDSLHLYKHDISSPICKWYDDENGSPKQHPFEYEFVVNQPTGYHKIFNNLMIISNNVEPESLEIEIVGDAYDYKHYFDNIEYKFPTINLPNNKTYYSKLQLDKVTNENRIIMHQDCLNINDFGRRLGNISYIEGKWYIVLQPIYYTQTDEKNEKNILKTTRLRDKWAKIRIKYSGEKLAIITAIQTLMNISYV